MHKSAGRRKWLFFEQRQCTNLSRQVLLVVKTISLIPQHHLHQLPQPTVLHQPVQQPAPLPAVNRPAVSLDLGDSQSMDLGTPIRRKKSAAQINAVLQRSAEKNKKVETEVLVYVNGDQLLNQSYNSLRRRTSTLKSFRGMPLKHVFPVPCMHLSLQASSLQIRS